MDDRYTPCQILYKNGVSSTCWFEDAVSHHGVPTGLNDLYFCDKECKPFRRLVQPTRPDDHTFLLNTTDWGFPAERLDGGQLDSSDNNSDNSPDSRTTPSFFPRLADLVDALIDSILDARDGGKISDHLIMMLAYLYHYVAILKQASFAEQLAYEHRQFHYDMQSIHNLSLRFLAHERRARQ